MQKNRMQQARIGALVIGAVAVLGACGGSGETNTAGGESAAAGTGAAQATGGAADSAGAMVGAAGDSMAGMAHGAAGAAGAVMGDPAIVGMVSTSNAAEITTSELARDKATSAEVKSFARDMITQHRANQGQVDQLVKQANMTPQPPAAADQMQQMVTATTDSLKTLTGAAFDQKYMAFQVQSHQMTLDNLQRFETQAQNAAVKAQITKTIPVVRSHLERAQRIQTSLGGAATTNKS